MNSGETRVIEIAAKDAYGLHRDDLVLEAARDQFPENLELEVGMQLQMEEDDGLITVVTVHELSESSVTLDANHPLAGKNLTFEITLVDIESK
jgi:FKBP-type peptidyl-prolyl cis-trans isomerase 2